MKKAYTLAEVLITLAIIGVISALMVPTMVQNTAKAHIGPKLSKARASIQLGNRNLLHDSGVDKLSDLIYFSTTGVTSDTVAYDYMNALKKFLKISGEYHAPNVEWGDSSEPWTEGRYYILSDGMSMNLVYDPGLPRQEAWANSSIEAPHKQYMGDLYIDINGSTKPNKMGRDIFYFTLWNDGSIKPYGSASSFYNPISYIATSGGSEWQNHCPINSAPDDFKYCAGHIFENNLKVLYK